MPACKLFGMFVVGLGFRSASALPPACDVLPHNYSHGLTKSGLTFECDRHACQIGLKAAGAQEIAAPQLMSSPNTSHVIECVLGCLVPDVFALLALENFGAEAAICAGCAAAHLADDKCETYMQDALYLPIMLMPATALAVFEKCGKSVNCPWDTAITV
ncbi:unnamed protein product [Prorocentrum cordatum]|uniref:Uncharacterized protein n=1 Tax=Prorocentrum cordatum TaxID=2364126 RepID=A0ABN9VIF6_9DINO|nr:unnamed protein product [Polarella glacialis]